METSSPQAGFFGFFFPPRQGEVGECGFLVALSPNHPHAPQSLTVVFSKEQLRGQVQRLLRNYPQGSLTNQAHYEAQIEQTPLIEGVASVSKIHVVKNAGRCLGEVALLFFPYHRIAQPFLQERTDREMKEWEEEFKLFSPELEGVEGRNFILVCDRCLYILASKEHLRRVVHQKLSPNKIRAHQAQLEAVPLPEVAQEGESLQIIDGAAGEFLNDLMWLWHNRGDKIRERIAATTSRSRPRA